MGLLGTQALTMETRQLYSLLSSLQKLSTAQKLGVAGQLCWGQRLANICCWRVGQAAVQMLQAALPAAGAEAPLVLAAPGIAPAAAAAEEEEEEDKEEEGRPHAAAEQQQQQQPVIEFLPSLVIFGRCCLFWAEQLHQQPIGQSSCTSSQPAAVAAAGLQYSRLRNTSNSTTKSSSRTGCGSGA